MHSSPGIDSRAGIMTEHRPQPSGVGRSNSGPFTDLYDRATESLLDVPIEGQWIDTEAGRTHMLTAGNPSKPPVVVLQGGNITTPVTLSWVQALADDYHLIAPDTPGQPGRTMSVAPPEYGPWVVELLDELNLNEATMIGASHGAGVLLETAAHAPDRIETAALVVPAGFGTPLSLALVRIVVLSLGYKLFPRRRVLHWALAPMFTQQVSEIDAVVIETVGKALRTGELTAAFPGPDDFAELSGFQAPTLVITAEHDPFFPGTQTCKRAAHVLPSPIECTMLTDERHFLSPAGRDRATDRIRTFLAENGTKSC